MNEYALYYNDSKNFSQLFKAKTSLEVMEYIFKQTGSELKKVRFLPVEDTSIYTGELGETVEVRKIDFTWRKRNKYAN